MGIENNQTEKGTKKKLDVDLWIIALVTFVAIYGMLMVAKKLNNSWGCVFAFLFIWNAF